MRKMPYERRINEFRRRLSRAEIDTAWIVQPENRRYLSGFMAPDAQLTESSGSLLISKDKAFLVTDSRFTTMAENEAEGFDIHTFTTGLVEDLAELLEGLGTRALGFEENHVTWGLHRELEGRFKECSLRIELVALNGIVEDMRKIKDDQELRDLKASADLMVGVLEGVVKEMLPGMTEREVAWRIEGLAHERGADEMAFPSIVASGPNGALPHAVPTDRKLRTGEPIVIDVGAKLHGYCSDMTRTVFLGDPADEFKIIYDTVRRAQLAALTEIEPGKPSTDPDQKARDLIKDAGYGDYFVHGLGHGVGLATHEPPRLGPRNPVELEKGMVVTVEPGIYIPGKGGVRLEQMVVIEEKGPRILTGDSLFYAFST